MNGATTALAIVALVVFGTIAFALLGVRRIKMDPQQYIVGGRSFGTVFLWVLLAGEIYTTFTFLGIAGLSYSQGAPAFYVMAYGACAYVIGYFLAPAVWRVGQRQQPAHRRRFLRDALQSRAPWRRHRDSACSSWSCRTSPFSSAACRFSCTSQDTAPMTPLWQSASLSSCWRCSSLRPACAAPPGPASSKTSSSSAA